MEKDFIKDLFADKLANAAAPVNPELWNAISAKVAAQTAVSTGLSATAKIIIGLGTAATITVASLVYFNQTEEKQSSKENKTTLSPAPGNTETQQETPPVAQEQSKTNTLHTAARQVISGEEIYFVEQYPDESIITNPDVVGYENPNKGVTSDNKPLVSDPLPVNKNPELKVFFDKGNKAAAGSDAVEKTNDRTVEIGELPNIFTPNNDNENDYFFVPVKGIQDFVLTILNQNNETVFQTTDPNFKWDGRDMQGNMIPSGSKLVYFFTGKSSQGDTISRHNRLDIRY